MEENNVSEQQPVCPNCNQLVLASDTFCRHCGKALAVEAASPTEDVFTTLRPTLLYYFITLLLLATYKFTPLFPEGLEGFVWVSVIDILITIAFWFDNRAEIAPLFSLSRVNAHILMLTVLGAVVGSVVVSVVANIINLSIQDDVFYSTYLFEDTRYPFLFATLAIAVQPAIFEEIAFRGFLYNNLAKITTSASVIYITAFVFGIIHLQIISLLWLVPIGLAFAILRNKYNTLWYGVAGHFVYNFCITVYEFLGWF